MLKDHKPQLHKVVDYGDEITLVPYSGIQILDFGFDLHSLNMRPFKFLERDFTTERGEFLKQLHCLTNPDNPSAVPSVQPTRDDDEYSIRIEASLEPFLEKWVPVPVLRIQDVRRADGKEQFDQGPTNWARMRIVELPESDSIGAHTHRIQLALDTSLEERTEEQAYVAPEISDAQKSREFRLVTGYGEMGWFLKQSHSSLAAGVVDGQRWVSEWLETLFHDFKKAERPNFNPNKHPHSCEHWARYITYLSIVSHATNPPIMRFVDTVSPRDALNPVNVDLVLDIGNSRTCGIAIEQFPGGGAVDLRHSYQLEIRDLGKPEMSYKGLFPSRVEFADINFGPEYFSQKSGRGKAFVWPSIVRMGSEAIRLVQGEEGTETTSGLSSPKRYLWDTELVQQDWRFHNHKDDQGLPRCALAAMKHLNETGDVLAQIAYDEENRLRPRGEASRTFAIRPRFSRSSLFGFMLSEIIAHAMVQINDPAAKLTRAQKNLPRRLNRIILSLPTATPIKEQAIIRSRTHGAVKIIWEQLAMGKCQKPYSDPPEILVDWDESSCSQLVYLYSEITQKFAGRMDDFLKLKGRQRQVVDKSGNRPTRGKQKPKEESTLRLASIDIGGGTTDLMITTYRDEDNKALHPEQTFREGFRIAGDDLIQRVVSVIVFPCIEESIKDAGGRFVKERLKELFAGDIGGQDQRQVQRRRQFALRVLIPIAEQILTRCEDLEEFEEYVFPAAEVLGLRQVDNDDDFDNHSYLDEESAANSISDYILGYLEEAAVLIGAANWKVANMVVSFIRKDVDAVCREIFQTALINMCEVIDHLRADIVLLTGRPSRLPAVRSLIEETLVIPPHRLISMHKYKAGTWYPFRDAITQRIGDPKSTVAVGGMLIALAESHIPNFQVMTRDLQMRSTAKFIGEMAKDGRITEDKILFKGVDLDSRRHRQSDVRVKVFSPVCIGARQLPLERWTTTPLYRLEFANNEARSRPLPVIVELEQSDFDDDESTTTEDKLRREAMREGFTVTNVEDNEGNQMRKSDILLRLHTMGFDDDYWIDSGVFSV